MDVPQEEIFESPAIFQQGDQGEHNSPIYDECQTQ